MAKETDPDRFQSFIDEIIFQCPDFHHYISRNGGVEKMRRLRHREFMINGRDNDGL
jgi:hypothetical protein